MLGSEQGGYTGDDAVDQWCRQSIPDIRWHDFVRNADIGRITNQPPLSSVIKSGRLTFFGHLARTDENADALPCSSHARTSSCLISFQSELTNLTAVYLLSVLID